MSELASGLAAAANTTTPAAPPPSAPSTPAPSAPSTPTSLADHFRSLESAPDPAPTETPAQEGQVPTTQEPQAPTPDGVSKEGPIPFQVHTTALKNAREKAAQEAEQRLMQQWQAEIEPVKTYLPIANTIAQDVQNGSVEGIARLITEYANHPQLGPQLRSMFGRMLGQRPQQQSTQPTVDAEPEADLQTAEGEPVYSAKQLKAWQQWNQRQQDAQLSERFAPAMEIANHVKAVRETHQQTQQYVQGAQPLLAELKALPGFGDFTKEIATKQAELFQQAYDQGQKPDVVSLWFRAYREVVPAKLQAKQQETLQQTALAKAAGRDANPASVAASPPPTPKTLQEAFAQVGLR